MTIAVIMRYIVDIYIVDSSINHRVITTLFVFFVLDRAARAIEIHRVWSSVEPANRQRS